MTNEDTILNSEKQLLLDLKKTNMQPSQNIAGSPTHVMPTRNLEEKIKYKDDSHEYRLDSQQDDNALAASSSHCVLNVEPILKNENNNGEMGSESITVHAENIDSKLNDFDSVSLSEPCCRVCQCNGSEERLINPCSCSGSVKWIHESCLIQWMKSSLKDSCELCTKKIKITKRRKPLSKWKLPSQRPTPVLWVLVFMTAIALNLASVVKDASKLCSSTPCLVFYAVGCIGVILGTLFLVYWSKRAKVFLNHWVELNEEWVIIVDEANQIEKKTNSGSEVRYYSTQKQDGKSSNCVITLNT